MKNILLFSYLISLFSCQATTENNSDKTDFKEAKTVIITPTRTFDAIDTCFFKDVNIITKYDKIYISDNEASRVIVADTTGKFIRIIGKKGEGPKEIDWAEQMFIKNNELHVISGGYQGFKVYEITTGAFLKAFKFSEEKDAMSCRYYNSIPTDNESNFYYTTKPINDGCIVKADKNGKKIIKFGKLTPYTPDVNQTFNRNFKTIVQTDRSTLITANTSTAVIEEYDFNGKLVKEYDISQIPEVKYAQDKMIEDFKKKPELIKMINGFILGIGYYNGYLYLMYGDRAIDRKSINHILVLDMNKNAILVQKIRFKTVLDDDDVAHLSLFVDAPNKKIYTQGMGTNNIYQFSIPEIK